MSKESAEKLAIDGIFEYWKMFKGKNKTEPDYSNYMAWASTFCKDNFVVKSELRSALRRIKGAASDYNFSKFVNEEYKKLCGEELF